MSETNGKEKKSFTVKGFFKSTSFKCIAVLLAIVLISGILLTICNSLFYVSADERLQRVLSNIYGREVTATEIVLDEPNIESYEIVTDGSTGDYGNSMPENVKDGSLFRHKTESDLLSLLNLDGEFTTGNLDGSLSTGATYSNFLCTYAALFAAVNYQNALDGREIAALSRTKYIDLENTAYSVDGSNVTFDITTTSYSRAGVFEIDVTVGENGVISSYTIVTNGSSPESFGDRMDESVLNGSLYIGKDGAAMLELFAETGMTIDNTDEVLVTGATYSNFLCAYAALFATANYEAIINDGAEISEELEYTQYINTAETTATVSEGGIDFTVVTTEYSRADAFTIDIRVRGGFETEYTGGNINSAYYIEDDGNYLVNATGTGGFSGGTVTCWVVINMNDGTVSGVGKVVIDSNSGQSYISRVNKDSVLSQFEGEFEEGEEASAWTGTGATMSLTAITGAVNTALSFAKEELASNTNPDPLAGYEYTDYINGYLTTVTTDGSNVNYRVVTSAFAPAQSFTIDITVGTGGVISDYEIITNGSTADRYIEAMPENVKDGSLYIGKDADAILSILSDNGISSDGVFEDGTDGNLHTGATYSNSLCTYAALFAAANYDYALENAVQYEYTQYINLEDTTYRVSGNTVTFTITTNGPTWSPFTIEVTVADGVITGFEIITNGSSVYEGKDYSEDMAEEVLNGSLFIGKNEEQLRALINADGDEFEYGNLDDSLHTRATQSNFACAYSALFATANYNTVLDNAGGVL